MKRLVYALFFGLILAGLVYLEPTLDLDSEVLLLTLLFTTPLVLVLAGVMSARYGRTGVSSILVFVGFLYALYLLPGGVPRDREIMERISDALLLILPVLMVFFTLVPDRGYGSFWGVVGLFVLGSGSLLMIGSGVLPAVWTPLGVFTRWSPSFLPSEIGDFFLQWDITVVQGMVLVAGFLALVGITLVRRRDSRWMAPWPYILLAFVFGISRMDHTGVLLYWVNGGLLFILAILIHEGWMDAFIDSLTGVLNRRALDQRLDRLRGKYILAMVDVDHFKAFNDTYGHEVGDQALRMVAGKIAAKPLPGKVYRYGGEEFTLILPRLSGDQGKDVLELIRKRIARATFTLRKGKKKVPITVSIGASSNTNRGKSPRVILKEADNALYKAKQQGRNRVVFTKT